MAYDVEKVKAWLSARGYSDSAVAQGIKQADDFCADTNEVAASIAMTRILYSDDQIDNGSYFVVDDLD